MPRRINKQLTTAKIRSITKPGTYSDGDGLSLAVAENSKSWRFRYRFAGKNQTISLGPERHLSLAEARKKVLQFRLMISEQKDPKTLIGGSRDVPTFKEAALAYIEQHEPTWRNAKHRQQWRNTLEQYIYPFIGDRRVDVIDASDVKTALDPIWLSRPETARRTKQRIGAVLDWSIALDHRSAANPVDALKKVMPKQTDRIKHHAALPYQDLPEFLKDLRQGKHGRSKLALEFLILTATRTGEARYAQWSEIDGDVWTIPADRMKARKEHRVPLSPRCMDILGEMPRFKNSPYIFPGQRYENPLSAMAFTKCLKRMNLSHITVHGFRSSFRDWCSEQTSAAHAVCEAALAHTVANKVEAAYRRTDLFDKRRVLMDQWCRFLMEYENKVVKLRA